MALQAAILDLLGSTGLKRMSSLDFLKDLQLKGIFEVMRTCLFASQEQLGFPEGLAVKRNLRGHENVSFCKSRAAWIS